MTILAKNLNYHLMIVAIFLCSLQSFYLETLGGPIIPYSGGIIVLFIAIVQISKSPQIIYLNIRFLVISIIFAIVALSSFIATGELRGASGVIFGCLVFMSFIIAMRRKLHQVISIIKMVLTVHVILLSFQVVIFIITGKYFDYLYFTDDHAVWDSRKGWVVAGQLIPRFTGAFNEPGSYSGVMGALLATYYYLKSKADLVFWAVWATLLASASLTGAILAAALLGGVLYTQFYRMRGGIRLVVGLIGMTASALAVAFILFRFLDRLQYTGGSEDFAILNILWLSSLDSPSLFGHSLNKIPDYVSLEYFGVWMTTYIQFGIGGIIALILLIYPIIFSNFAIASALVIAKVKITFPLIFVLLAAALIKKNSTKLPRPMPEGRIS